MDDEKERRPGYDPHEIERRAKPPRKAISPNPRQVDDPDELLGTTPIVKEDDAADEKGTEQ